MSGTRGRGRGNARDIASFAMSEMGGKKNKSIAGMLYQCGKFKCKRGNEARTLMKIYPFRGCTTSHWNLPGGKLHRFSRITGDMLVEQL